MGVTIVKFMAIPWIWEVVLKPSKLIQSLKKISDSYTSNSQTAGMIVLSIVLSINNWGIHDLWLNGSGARPGL